MQLFLVTVIAALSVMILITLAGFIGFGCRLLRYRPEQILDSQLPQAAIILSLRGGDSSLRKMLDGLVAQKYPHYRVYIVIDHRSDPAAEIVRRWNRTQARVPVQIEFLRERLPYCTLKFSAVRQVLQQLPGAHRTNMLDHVQCDQRFPGIHAA